MEPSSRDQKCEKSLTLPHVARVRPRLHCFGHVHASGGQVTEDGTLFVNATSVNSSYEIAHPPFEITL